MGALTPAGNSVAQTWDSMINGRSGVDSITLFDANEDWGVRFAGEVRGFDPNTILDAREQRRFDRFALLALAAATEAAQDLIFNPAIHIDMVLRSVRASVELERSKLESRV